MNDILTEIKALAKTGYQTANSAHETNSKDIFIEILLKADSAIHRLQVILPKHLQTPHYSHVSTHTYKSHTPEEKAKAYMVAYCFSTYEHHSLYPGKSQTDAFDTAARKLGIKHNTLKSFRDTFDGDNPDSRRVGWQRPLPYDMQEFKDKIKTKSRAEVIAAAREILGIK